MKLTYRKPIEVEVIDYVCILEKTTLEEKDKDQEV